MNTNTINLLGALIGPVSNYLANRAITSHVAPVALVQQRVGYKIALGIKGILEDEQENTAAIERKVTSLIALGAISSYRHAKHPYDALHMGNPDSFQYVLLTEEQLRDYFIALVSMSFNPDRLESLAMVAYIRNQANSMLASIPYEDFLGIDKETQGSKSKERDNLYMIAKEEIKELKEHPENEMAMT